MGTLPPPRQLSHYAKVHHLRHYGCAKSFKALLNRISFSQEDELYLLGDYIDRGPDSKGVIDHIWHLQETGHQVQCLRGNHEQLVFLANID